MNSYKKQYDHCITRFVDISKSMFADIQRLEEENKQLKADMDKAIAQANKPCIDIYMSIHVSQLKDQPEYIKRAWSIGQELVIARRAADE